MTYQLPPREIEKILRIVKTNCQIHIGNLYRLPEMPNESLNSAICALQDAIGCINAYAYAAEVEILESMPT